MKRLGFVLQFLVFFSLSTYSSGQQWSGILSPLTSAQKNTSRSAVDWSTAGVPGGIPSGGWTQCGSTMQASAFGNGATDATSAINAGLSACGPNQYVLLSPGTFLVNSSGAGSPIIQLKKNNVVLRGSGASKTILNSTGTDGGLIVRLGTGQDPGTHYGTNKPITNSMDITSGATAGSTSIMVSSAINFAVGKNMLIQELNDPNYVSNVGGSGTCTYCDGFWNGTRTRGQIVEITSVNGTTIGFTPALYTAYTLTPQALPFMPVKYAGVENLQIVSNNTHTRQNNQPIMLYTCSYCWAKGIEENYADGDYVKVFWGFHDEVRDSYFSNNFNHGPGQNNGSVELAFKTSASKIENNIIERCENPVMLVFGAAGNVVAYNYATGCFGRPATVTISIEWHSAHEQFNLVEGNVVPALWLDVGHGSTSQTTSFRNWYQGTGFVCPPNNETRAAVDCSGANGLWTTDGARAIGVDSLSTYNNFVGDVIGSSMQESLPGTYVAVIKWPSTRVYRGTSYGLSFGYTLFGDTGANTFDSTAPYKTSFIHGLYNNIDGSTTWGNGVKRTLPASFYLSEKPDWWGDISPFPAIGPDVTGGAGPGGHVNRIPAEVCFYTKMGGKEGGAGSPRSFDAASCYGAPALKGVVR